MRSLGFTKRNLTILGFFMSIGLVSAMLVQLSGLGANAEVTAVNSSYVQPTATLTINCGTTDASITAGSEFASLDPGEGDWLITADPGTVVALVWENDELCKDVEASTEMKGFLDVDLTDGAQAAPGGIYPFNKVLSYVVPNSALNEVLEFTVTFPDDGGYLPFLVKTTPDLSPSYNQLKAIAVTPAVQTSGATFSSSLTATNNAIADSEGEAVQIGLHCQVLTISDGTTTEELKIVFVNLLSEPAVSDLVEEVTVETTYLVEIYEGRTCWDIAGVTPVSATWKIQPATESLQPSYSNEIQLVCPGSTAQAYSKRTNRNSWDFITEITASQGEYFSLKTESCWTKTEVDASSDVLIVTESNGTYSGGAALTSSFVLSTSGFGPNGQPNTKYFFTVKPGVQNPKLKINRYNTDGVLMDGGPQSYGMDWSSTFNLVPISPATVSAVGTLPGTFYICANPSGSYITSGPGGTGENLLGSNVVIGAEKTNTITIVNECSDHYGLGSWNSFMRPISFSESDDGITTTSVYEVSADGFNNPGASDFPNFALYFYKVTGTNSYGATLYGNRGANLGTIQFRKRSLATYSGGSSGSPAAPGSPTSVQATGQVGSALVSWAVPTTGGTPSSYTVTANPSGLTCTSSGTSCTVTGLTNGSYTFTVVATNATGNSAPSIPSTSVTVTAGSGGGNNGAPGSSNPSTPAPTSPTINLPSGSNGSSVGSVSAQPGQVFTLTGSGMNTVNTVNVGGKKAVITLKTATKLGFKLPNNLPAGLYDLSLYGSFGSMTEAKFFSVAKKKIKQTSFGFAGNSDVLSLAIKADIRQFFGKLPGNVTLVCEGSTSGTTVTKAARKLARDRATEACEFAREINPSLKTEIRITPATGVGYKYRSVKLTLKNY